MNAGWREVLRRRADRVLRPGGRAVILLYHRIAEDATDPYGLCVTPAHFEEHLLAIRRMGQPMALPRLARSIRAGEVPDGAVCVTFDDGYADNLLTARPLLARHDVPATVFVTTGRGGRDREFWWDELQRAFFEPVHLPQQLEVSLSGRHHVWDLGGDALYPAEDHRRHLRWHIFDEATPSSRHGAFRDAYVAIKPLPPDDRARVLDGLLEVAGINHATVRPTRRAMEPAEVAELASGGLVHIGAHTVTHPALPTQEAAVQRREVSQSKADVESWLRTEADGFAYPYGLHDASSVAAVRAAGFEWACSCMAHAASRRSDLLLLPRIEVPDCDGDAFAELLNWELHARRSAPRRVAG